MKALKKTVSMCAAATLCLSLTALSVYRFALGPRLTCAVSAGNSGTADIAGVLADVKSCVTRELADGDVKDIAVYCRELKNGAWFGINVEQKFNTASLLKVPMMMEFLDAAQTHPELLRDRLLFTGEEDGTSRQVLKPAKTLEIAKSYSVDELMFRMIAYSDNNATLLLLKEMPLDGLYRYLDARHIDYSTTADGSMMSLHSYARFFEALYDRSALNRAMSQKALAYLSAEDFPKGMRAAVPSEVAIAGKFGEKESFDRDGGVKSVQLHEVAIIFDRDQPLLLGVMTRGRDIEALEKVIRDITRRVYTDVEHHG